MSLYRALYRAWSINVSNQSLLFKCTTIQHAAVFADAVKYAIQAANTDKEKLT